MAANGEAQKDYQAHQAAYSGFLSLFKVGTIASLLIAGLVILLIAQ